MPANRQIVREVIRDWSDQPECDKLGSHEEEELTDKIVSDALPAIRAQRDEELRKRLEKLSAEWERQAERLRQPHSPSRQVNVNRRERARVCDENARYLREVVRSIFEEGDDVD